MNPPRIETVTVTRTPDPRRRRALWELVNHLIEKYAPTTPPAPQARHEQAEPDTAA